jgi:hypothetical protein
LYLLVILNHFSSIICFPFLLYSIYNIYSTMISLSNRNHYFN